MISRATTLNLMGGEEATSINRSSGGTVLFVEAPETNAGAANIFLQSAASDRAKVLSWAVYQNTTNVALPGVNDFASISSSTGAIVSAEYQLGSFYMNPLNWGLDEVGSDIDASEGGTFQVNLDDKVSATIGSNMLIVESSLRTSFETLSVGMSAFGPGLPAATKIVALDTEALIITLNNASTESGTELSYSFSRPRAYSGRVGIADSNLELEDDVNRLGYDRTVNTLRYYSNADSVITIDEGSTLKLASGAILVGANVLGGAKSIIGPGNITGLAEANSGGDFIIHNYNPVTPFTVGANIVDTVLVLQRESGGGTPTGLGTVAAGKAFLGMPEDQYDFINKLNVGMEVIGLGLESGTYITSINKNSAQVNLSKPAVSSHVNAIYTFLSRTSFVQTGTGTTVLSGNNVYTGDTFVHGGVLRLDSANAVPGGVSSTAPLASSSHIIIKDGVLGLNYENFSRTLGVSDNQVEFKGSGGFAAYGEDRTVNFGGLAQPKVLRYGNEGFVADGSSLILGATDATHKVTLLNPIDLGSFSQAVRVDNGPADIEGELAGGLSGVGKLIKFGQGSLRLSGQNTQQGGIEIAEGRLVVANVPDVFGVETGIVTMGTSYTNTAKDANLELTLEGGIVDNDLHIGGVNTRGADWISHGPTDSSAGDLGSYSSMAVVNGYPAIAYYDATAGDLKYVRAADARGNSWLAPVTLASGGDVGQHPSLSIINGNPAVSYYDATNGTLCYIRSTDNSGVFWGSSVIADSNPVSALGMQS
ncbi:MAG: autotransporter-associated beta strand repeat-containing protein, partial [Prosthecobacter sp.]|nr:autotransporter-associated beta strand repeat-containing protein [Prosthecobacter sp.]